MEKTYRVNEHYSYGDDSYDYSITEVDNASSSVEYTGVLYGTRYDGGCDWTDWGVFYGSYEQCENWVNENKR